MTEQSRDLKDQILATIPLESFIGRYVTLKKQGKYFKGLCPFHREKTPSFTVTPERGLFHCFGCGEGGDLFHFAMKIEGITFPEALEMLARIAGIEYSKKSNSIEDEYKKRLYETNEIAARHYQEFLYSTDGFPFLKYLKERGIKLEKIKQFAIGGAPDGWRFLTDQLTDRQSEALELGLLRQKNERNYDFFRRRVMFPIHDLGGRIVAFGGRVLPGEKEDAKYLNSPESPIFHKSASLYGLYQNVSGIRSGSEALIVEGYLDVIGLVEAGIPRAVAPLGTALSPGHLQMIHRYANRVIFFMDGDRAGRAAGLKFARLSVDYGSIQSYMVLLPDGLDPFDLSRTMDRDGIERLLEKKVSAEKVLLKEVVFPDGFQEFCREGKSISGVQTPMSYAELAYEYYEKLDQPGIKMDLNSRKSGLERLVAFSNDFKRAGDREIFLLEGARILGLSPGAVESELQPRSDGEKRWNHNFRESSSPSTAAGQHRSPAMPTGGEKKSAKRKQSIIEAERLIVVEFLSSASLASRYRDRMEEFDFQDSHSEILWRYLENRLFHGNTWNEDSLGGFDLPVATVSVFDGLLILREQEKPYRESLSENLPSRELIVEDLFYEHRIRLLRLELEGKKEKLQFLDELAKDELNKEIYKTISEIQGLQKKKKELFVNSNKSQ